MKLEVVGHGSQGISVLKIKNLNTGGVYAMKRIPFDVSNNNSKKLIELLHQYTCKDSTACEQRELSSVEEEFIKHMNEVSYNELTFRLIY